MHIARPPTILYKKFGLLYITIKVVLFNFQEYTLEGQTKAFTRCIDGNGMKNCVPNMY